MRKRTFRKMIFKNLFANLSCFNSKIHDYHQHYRYEKIISDIKHR